jgi:hypothetical protein
MRSVADGVDIVDVVDLYRYDTNSYNLYHWEK